MKRFGGSLKHLVLIVALLTLSAIGYTVTVNPASMVTADSANTPLTIPYRDSTGAYASVFPSKTIAQLLATVPIAKGENYFCTDCSPAKNVVSTGTAVGNFADPAGAAFK